MYVQNVQYAVRTVIYTTMHNSCYILVYIYIYNKILITYLYISLYICNQNLTRIHQNVCTSIVQITANTNLDRVLFISSCEAYPASNSYYKRLIISDGCANEEAVAVIGAHDNNYAAFRMQTFRVTYWPDEPIILNCTIQVCFSCGIFYTYLHYVKHQR